MPLRLVLRPTPCFATVVVLLAAGGLACGDGNGPSPTPATVLVTPAGPLTVPSGTGGQLVATVLDRRGATIPGTEVTWASSAPSIVGVTATGLYTGALVGRADITATAGTAVSTPVTVTVTPGPAASALALAGANQAGKVVATVADTMVVLVADAAGNPVSGHTVGWQVTAGSGTLAVPSSVTDGAGHAWNVLTLGTQSGLYRVQAVVVPGPLVAADFQVNAVAGPPVMLGVVNHFLVGDSGTTVVPPWGAVDQYGNATSVPAGALVSRAPAVVGVNGTGSLTLASRGQGVVVADLGGGVADSLLVAPAEPAGPVLSADLTEFGVVAGGNLTATLILDMRSSGELLGATTVQVAWDPALMTYVSDADPGSGVGATVNITNAAAGSLSLAAASSSGLAGAVALRAITFQVTATAGVTGALGLGTTEVTAAITFRNLLGRTLTVSHPLISR